jgi:exopolysaccharide biosynthesis polyprenyl glycosylphosphotransferase
MTPTSAQATSKPQHTGEREGVWQGSPKPPPHAPNGAAACAGLAQPRSAEDASQVALRLGLQRHASTNFRRHFARHVRRVSVLFVADLAAVGFLDAMLTAARNGGADFLSVLLSLPIATPRYLVALFLGILISGSYSEGDARRSARRLLYGVSLATVLELWTIVWAAGLAADVSRTVATAALVLATLLLERFAVDRLVAVVAPYRQHAARTIFAGPAHMCREASVYPALRVARDFRQLGFLDAHSPVAPDALGGMDDLGRVLHDLQVDTVVICGALSDLQFQSLVGVALAAGCHILTVPRAIELAGVQPSVLWSHGVPLTQLTAPALRGRQYLIKRVLDFCLAATALVALSPLLVLVAAAVWLDSGRPVFFRQRRVGLGGSEFWIAKFRTMVPDADARRDDLLDRSLYTDGRLFKVKDDPRVTRLGSVLRRTSLDELPQLWNVLLGDMSLVGPRPPMTSEVALYEMHHYARFYVRPGITGPWQVNGRNSVTDFEEVIRLENDYIRDWSIWKDLGLLIRTVPAVLFMRGAV